MLKASQPLADTDPGYVFNATKEASSYPYYYTPSKSWRLHTRKLTKVGDEIDPTEKLDPRTLIDGGLKKATISC